MLSIRALSPLRFATVMVVAMILVVALAAGQHSVRRTATRVEARRSQLMPPGTFYFGPATSPTARAIKDVFRTQITLVVIQRVLQIAVLLILGTALVIAFAWFDPN
jgi:hypothetical protein